VVPAAGAVLVLVVAAIGYELYIPIHHVERARLSRLAVIPPPAGFKAKPANASELAAADNPFAAFKTAASHSPNATGAYSVHWSDSASTSDIAQLLVAWLPSTADAAAVAKQATTTYLAPTSFKTDSYTLLGRLTVPGVPAAAGASFGPAPSKGTERLSVATFQDGRFVVVDYVQQSGADKASAAAVALAQAESARLKTVGSGFTLRVTSWPLVASLIYAGVAVAIAVLVIVVPLGLARSRRHQRLARQAMARRAVQGRGHKIAKHQAARPRSR
jgi:hypothetical protein